MRRIVLVSSLFFCVGCAQLTSAGHVRLPVSHPVRPATLNRPPSATSTVSGNDPGWMGDPDDLKGMPKPGSKPPGANQPSPLPEHYSVTPLDQQTGDVRARVLRNTRGDLVLQSALIVGKQRRSIALPDGQAAEAMDLNERGQVLVANRARELYLWSAGKAGATGMHADWMGGAGINDSGNIASTEPTGRKRPDRHMPGAPISHATLTQGGRRRDLGALRPNDDSAAMDVNNLGQVIGVSGSRGFIWENGRMTDLGMLPGYFEARPAAINNHGQVVGTLTGQQDMGGAIWGDAFQRAFLWQKGRMYDLPTRSDSGKTYATDINDAGDAIGYAYYMHHMPEPAYVPILWRHGRMYNLNTLVTRYSGWEVLRPLRIDNRGRIVAIAAKHGGPGDHSYIDSRMGNLVLLTPGAAAESAEPIVVTHGDTRRLPRIATPPSPPTRVRFEMTELPAGADTAFGRLNNRGDVACASFEGGAFFIRNGRRTAIPQRTPPLLGALHVGDDGSVLMDSANEILMWKDGKILWSHGAPDDLRNANGHGVAVGCMRHYSPGGDTSDAGVYDKGRFARLPALPGGGTTEANDINDAGQIAGRSGDRPVLWTNGRPRDLGLLPDYVRGTALLVNARGQVAGLCFNDADLGYAKWSGAYARPFLWENGRMRDLGVLPVSRQVRLSAMNSRGDIVGGPNGCSNPPDPGAPVTIWMDGHPYDLNKLLPAACPWVVLYASDINDQREIVVAAQRKSDIGSAGLQMRLFLLRPR